MENLNQQGVFEHLRLLETAGTSGLKGCNKYRLEELHASVATLQATRDRLCAETTALKNLKDKMDQGLPLEDNITGDFLKPLLISRRMQLKDIRTGHHLIGGYDLIETKQGKVSRHNIPPCIPLERLVKQNLQTDLQAFLQTLGLYLNALEGRKKQISLIQELLSTIKVIEKNQLCNFLVIMCKAQEETDTEVQCTLEYGDLTKYLPTHVTIESQNKPLIESPQWKKNEELLKESPVHNALLTMRKMRSIV